MRKWMIRLCNDPACELEIHGTVLQLPLSHSLPINLRDFPFYDQLLSRLSYFLHNQYGYVQAMDIGANIGDTLAAMHQNSDRRDFFLAVEPNSKFFHYFMLNWQDKKNVIALNALCSDAPTVEKVTMIEKNGSASISPTNTGTLMKSYTLDELLEQFPQLSQINLVKIDTDGYDFTIINGARRLLSNSLPALLFECDHFGKLNYAQTAIQTLTLLNDLGYRHALVYDNCGYLMGKFDLQDMRQFKNLLFYQISSPLAYFDILVMQERILDRFFDSECRMFLQTLRDSNLAESSAAILQS